MTLPGGDLFVTLLGAVALLMWGVRMVRTGLTRAFGTLLRQVLTQASRNRMTAFATGAGVATVLQSATATTVLLASFTGRGLITLPIALAVVLGADVGSTLVAQVFAADVKWLWAVALVIGVGLFQASRTDRTKNAGRIAIGLGLMLLSLSLLSGVAGQLRSSPMIGGLLATLSAQPVLGMVVAAVLTWIAHSSLAMILFVMSLAASGAIGPSLALALVLGVNLGGAVTPLLALSSSPVASRRVPLGNLIARGVCVAGVLAIAHVMPDLMRHFGLRADTQVLVFHTAFNVLVAALFLPLVGPLARLTAWLLPDADASAAAVKPLHLEPTALDSPSEALACAMRETLHIGDRVLDMLRRSLDAIAGSDGRLIKDIEKADDDIDRLHEAVKLYLIQVSRADMTEAESQRAVEILTFNTNLEHIGDIVDKNLMELAAKKLKKQLTFSPEGLEDLRRFHGKVVENLRLALNVFATRDVVLARRLLRIKTDLRSHESEAAEQHYSRLRDRRPESLETSSIHLDIVRDLKRINSHLTSVAYPILESAGELRDSRLMDSAPAPLGSAGSGSAR